MIQYWKYLQELMNSAEIGVTNLSELEPFDDWVQKISETTKKLVGYDNLPNYYNYMKDIEKSDTQLFHARRAQPSDFFRIGGGT